MNAGGALRWDPLTNQRRAVFFEFMNFSASRRLFSRAMAPYGGLGASTANAQNAHFCQGTKPMRWSESLRPVKGAAHSRVGTAPSRNSFFRPDVSIFVEIRLRRKRASLHKPQKARALRSRARSFGVFGARDGGVSMQKHARRQNRRAYTYFPFSARKIRRTRICG